MFKTRVRGLVAVVGLMVLMGAACGGDDDEEAAEPPATTTTVAETTTTTESPWTPEEQEVIDAHEAAVDASLDAAEGPEPDPDAPALEDAYTGERLDMESTTLEAMALNGTAFRFPDEEDEVHSIAYNSVTFDQADGMEVAYLEVCTVTNLEEYVVETGKALSRSGLRTTTATLTFHSVDGQWKVAETEHHNTEDGEAECVFD